MASPGLTLNGLNVLVVEDDALVCMMIEDLLVDLGCRVAAIATKLDEGLRLAATLAFDAAILDVNLAGVRSYPLAEQLERRDIPFVLATAYDAASLPPQLQTAVILPKPFGPQQLTDALQRALHGGPAAVPP